MNDQHAIKDLARAYTRDELRNAGSFHGLAVEDQKALYRDIYRQHYDRLMSQSRGAYPTAFADPKKASELIDDERHYNKRIDQAGELAGEFVDEVDFPGFVKDLLKGVFDANLMVTLQQMEAFQKLFKSASQDLAKLVNAIDDNASIAYVAENNSDEFNIDFGEERDDDGNRKLILTDKEGQPLDLGDNQLKARIMDAKIQMAREQRAMLRETILMGITRLIVEKGNVKASVVFDIKASERIDKSDKAALKEAKSTSGSISHSTGPIGSLLGGALGGGLTRSSQKSRISVSSAKSQSSTDLAAKVMGSVDITFRSDFFKLDNFAQMYGPAANQPLSGAPVPGAPRPPAAGTAPALPAAVPAAPGGGPPAPAR
jgi:hypothetical protein